MSQAERAARPTAGIVAITGGVVLAIASFLPWAEVSGQGASVTAKGIDGSDGFVTLGAGIVAVLVGVVIMMRGAKRVLAVIAILAGIVGGGIALYDAVTAKDSVLDAAAEELAPSFGVSTDQVRAALDQAVDAGQIGVSVSWGLYLAVAGGLVALVGGVLGLRVAAAEPAASTAEPMTSTPPPDTTSGTASTPPPDTTSGTAAAPPPDMASGTAAAPPPDMASGTAVAPPPPPPPGPDDA